ncbi:MAG: hypothetical protein JXR76_03400 [Deltaproteobacteria bacterium]|nr:hypothetical protein [Deltaproteobacteria bacterium]
MKKYKSGRSRQWWADLHEEWESSGRSIVDFCKERGVRFQLFFNWRSKFRQDGLISQTAQKAAPKAEASEPTVEEQSIIYSDDKRSIVELPDSPELFEGEFLSGLLHERGVYDGAETELWLKSHVAPLGQMLFDVPGKDNRIFALISPDNRMDSCGFPRDVISA